MTGPEAERLTDPGEAAAALDAVAPLIESNPSEVLRVCSAIFGKNPFIARPYVLMGEVLRRTGNAEPLHNLLTVARAPGHSLVMSGRIHEAAAFYAELGAAFPDPFLPYALLYGQVSELTRRYREASADRSTAGSKRRLVIALSVWGDRYADILSRYLIPSFLARGNLPALAEYREVHFDIYTTAKDADALRRMPSFTELERFAKVYLTLFDDAMVASAEYARPESSFRYRMFGGFHHVAMERARSMDADLCPIAPDGAWSDGALASFVGFVDSGYDCVLATAVRAQAEATMPILDAMRRSETDPLEVPSRKLVEINLQNIHHDYRQFLLMKGNRETPAPPSVLAFPHAHGLYVRCLHIHPVVLSSRAVARATVFDYEAIDSAAIARLFPARDDMRAIKVIQDSDDGYVLDLTFAFDPKKQVAPGQERSEFTLDMLLKPNARTLDHHYWAFDHRIDFHGDAKIEAIGVFERLPDGSLRRAQLPIAARIDLGDEDVARWLRQNRPNALT